MNYPFSMLVLTCVLWSSLSVMLIIFNRLDRQCLQSGWSLWFCEIQNHQNICKLIIQLLLMYCYQYQLSSLKFETWWVIATCLFPSILYELLLFEKKTYFLSIWRFGIIKYYYQTGSVVTRKKFQTKAGREKQVVIAQWLAGRLATRGSPGFKSRQGREFFNENKWLIKFKFEWSCVESRFYTVSGSW